MVGARELLSHGNAKPRIGKDGGRRGHDRELEVVGVDVFLGSDNHVKYQRRWKKERNAVPFLAWRLRVK
jgi:hypothetical protein